jgi:hypothetical protein
MVGANKPASTGPIIAYTKLIKLTWFACICKQSGLRAKEEHSSNNTMAIESIRLTTDILQTKHIVAKILMSIQSTIHLIKQNYHLVQR